MGDEDEGIPIDDLRTKIYFEGIELRKDAQQLLQRCRKFKPTFRNSIRRKELQAFSKEYDTLYGRYVRHDANVSSYCGMVSNPWQRTEEDGQIIKDIEHVTLLNISSQGLSSQRETIRAVFVDISNQISGIGSDSNNRIVNVIAGLSLLIALVSLVVSLIALLK